MTDAVKMAIAVTKDDAVKFLENACRNWKHVPRLSNEDIADVMVALAGFAKKVSTTAPEQAGEPEQPLTTLQRLGQEFDAEIIRGTPYDPNDDYIEVRRDERERVIAALSRGQEFDGEGEVKAKGMDEGADFCIQTLAEALGVEDWDQADGSETWDGDVAGTIYNVLKAGRVYDDEDGRVARLDDRSTPTPAQVEPVAYRYVHLDYAGRKVSRYGAHPERVNGHDPIETHPLYASPPARLGQEVDKG
ncbi:hypothetical protein [Sphingobium yanoikuyae]|uniref:hypothetical protein n=1 Tax=Sphingobium yanoikuyae TaxID=13690 RepID=UPI0028A6B4E9|nr:hypothetical protein [Sphingobium yanoikuyae]